MPHVALWAIAVLTGIPDSLPGRLARLDHAIWAGNADSIWAAASGQATRHAADRLAALEAGAAATALSRPAAARPYLLHALSRPDTVTDLIDATAALWLGTIAVHAGKPDEARRWLEPAVATASRLGAPRIHADAVALLAELDVRAGRAIDGLARLDSLGTASGTQDPAVRSRIACSQARILAVLGRHDDADSAAHAGIAVARKLGLRIQAGGCQASIGIALAQRSSFFAADTSLAAAVVLLEPGGAPRTLAGALQWRGYVLRELARLGEADSVLRLAVARADSLGDRGIRGWSRLNLGLIAATFGNLEAASAELDQAVAALDTVRDRWGSNTSLLTRAHVLRQLGELDSARVASGQVLAWAMAAGVPLTALQAHHQLAWIDEAEGRADEAAHHLGEARKIARTGFLDAALSTTYQQARHDVVMGNYARAIPTLRRYLADLGRVPQRRYAARARLAEALAGTGQVGAAAQELAHAMDDLDGWRTSLANDALRRAVFGASIDDPDPDLGVATVIARIAPNDPATAFALAERRRARGLGDRLLRLEAARLGQAHSLAAQPGVRSLDDIRAALPDSGGALVTFVVGRGREPATAFVLTRDTLRAVVLGSVDSLRDLIARTQALAGERPELPTAIVRALRGALVDPWLALLPRGTHTLVLVPEDRLHHVPFDLLLPSPRTAGRTSYVLAYAPSASILAGLRLPRAPPQGPILAFADPPLPRSGDPGFADWRGAAGPLPGARHEVRQIARGVAGVRVNTGPRARASVLREPDAATARVIHLATHAQVDERSPLGTFVWLAPGDGLDGRLTALEIEGLTLHAELVVLSACRTATGRLVVGEGVQGLTAPFLSAGARSVVASRWDVDDRATARVMEDFYQAMLEGEPVAAALARARNAARARREPASVWGAFVVVGDPWAAPRLAPAQPSRTPLLIVLGLTGAAGWWWARRRTASGGPAATGR